MSPSSSSAAAAAADLEHEHEYSDEEQLATVTVVEDFDPSVLLYHPTASGAELPAERSSPQPPPLSLSLSRENLKASRKNDGLATATKKLKKVRYETRAARKATRSTQRARRTEKAERAGGKAARKKTGGKKPRTRKK